MIENFTKPFAPPPVIFLVTLLIGVGLGVVFPFQLLPMVVQFIAGLLIVLTGVSLIRASMHYINTGDTTYSPYKPSTTLVTNGIFRFSRNPGYLGLWVIELGFAVLLDNIWIAATTYLAYLIITKFVIRFEEKKLLQTFDDAYAEYCKNTRRFF